MTQAKIFLTLFSLSLSLGLSIDKPNVIIFLADDLGWQDTELNDVDAPCPWETPNILSLAADGMNFLNGYSAAPSCSPSRGAIMSGQHPARVGFTHVAGGNPVFAHNPGDLMVSPHWAGRMDYNAYTIAEALKDAGYFTGHIGKWHCAKGHHLSPLSNEQGFTYMETHRGVTTRMDDRLVDFATLSSTDPFQLQVDLATNPGADRGGRPFDQLTQNALNFMGQAVSNSEPFFMYMAHWMVHTPIHTRDEALLEYYCDKLGLDYDGTATPSDPADDLSQFMNARGGLTLEGQNNPFYGAMVDTLDWSLGKVVDYLKATDDPRNPGKKLYETTYIIFTSDNGGKEGTAGSEIITDNNPLDGEKTEVREGGIRVPFIITGPTISASSSLEIVNGIDFYPTILDMTASPGRDCHNENLDGVSLFPYLTGSSNSIRKPDGSDREFMFWHFPHIGESKMYSAVRHGDYKLLKKYYTDTYELYKVTSAGLREDYEEEHNLISDPSLTALRATLISELESFLDDTDAQRPYFYADSTTSIPNQNLVPDFTSVNFNPATGYVEATYETSGVATVEKAYMYYTLNGGDNEEEWFEVKAEVTTGRATAYIPTDATHYSVCIIDANNFLRSNYNLDDAILPFSTQVQPALQGSGLSDPMYFLPSVTHPAETIKLFHADTSELGTGVSQLNLVNNTAGSVSISNNAFFGTALHFSSPAGTTSGGAEAIIEGTSNGALFPTSPNPSLTVEFWANFSATNTTTRQVLIDALDSSGGYELSYNGVNKEFQLTVSNGSTVDTLTGGFTDLTAGNWHFYSLFWDGATSSMGLFLDGELLMSKVASLSGMTSSSSDITLGSSNGNDPFSGQMDEIRFSSIAYNYLPIPVFPPQYFKHTDTIAAYDLSPTEVSTAAGDLSLTSGGSLHLASGQGFNGNALVQSSATSTSDNVQINNSAGASSLYPSGTDPSYKIEAWVRFDAINHGTDQFIFNTIDGSTGISLRMRQNSSDLLLQFRGALNSNLTASNTGINAGEWHHIAASWDAPTETAKLFIDYTEVTSKVISGLGGLPLGSGDVMIGNEPTTPAESFIGVIDGLRFSTSSSFIPASSVIDDLYFSWTQEYFTAQEIDTGWSMRNIDFDEDGILNGEEFLYSINPIKKDSIPALCLDGNTISYRTVHTHPSISHTLMKSSDLWTWSPLAIGSEATFLHTIDRLDGSRDHTHSLAPSFSGTPQSFYILEIKEVP